MKRMAVFLVMITLTAGVRAQSLEKTWATPPVFRTPESVNLDRQRNVLYVSNINGSPGAKDGNGFVSRLSPDGEILDLYWVTGLNAPKGAAVVGNLLYVADVDEVVVINVDKASVVKRIQCQNARFLNDVAVDAKGVVYVSDTSGKNSAVYRIKNDRPEIWLQKPTVRSPNGLAVVGNDLLIGNTGDGSLLRANLRTGKVELVAKVGFGIDGLKPDGKGNYVLSDWRGSLYLLTSSGSLKQLLKPIGPRVNAADIEYLPQKRLLLVPTFFDNRVVAYKLR